MQNVAYHCIYYELDGLSKYIQAYNIIILEKYAYRFFRNP